MEGGQEEGRRLPFRQRLETEPYRDQKRRWPKFGKFILAQYTGTSCTTRSQGDLAFSVVSGGDSSDSAVIGRGGHSRVPGIQAGDRAIRGGPPALHRVSGVLPYAHDVDQDQLPVDDVPVPVADSCRRVPSMNEFISDCAIVCVLTGVAGAARGIKR